MELTADLIAIQGILSSVVKTTGEFTKINYRGGNEEKIFQIIQEIQKYLISKSYLKNERSNDVYNKQLEEIVLFLAINTVYKHKIDLDEYVHLINIIPPLSKCVLANVAYSLDLCKHYCATLEKLPLEVSSELLDEMLPCLKKSVPNIQLEYSHIILMAAAKKLETVDYTSQTEDAVDDLTEVANGILRNLTGIYSDQTKNMNSMSIYHHMGNCLLSLFELLLYCDKDCVTLKKFIGNIIRTSCSIIVNVTLNVYCAWAEFMIDDEVFQAVVSEKAYMVMEAYQKTLEARDLISMLGTIARKPLSTPELIRTADSATVIKKIDKCDANQKAWFRALLTTQVFKNKDAARCLDKWSHLCDEEDVMLLLNLGIQTSDEGVKKIIAKCASSLNLEQLRLLLTRHFYKNKFSYILEKNIEPSLMLIFNKLNENSQSKPDLALELSLLLLLNPLMFYKNVYSECLKNVYYTDCLKEVFTGIKEISTIDSIGVIIFNEVLYQEVLNEQKVNNVSYLFKTLIEIGYFTNEVVLSKIMVPLLKKYHKDGLIGDLNFGFQIMLESNVTISVRNENRDFLEMCLIIMKENRCKFLNFNSTKQELVKSIVEMILDICEVSNNLPIEALEERTTEDVFTNYYKKYLSSNATESFFKSVCQKFDINDEGECVSQLLQVLPSAVPREWLSICGEIRKQYGEAKAMEILTDMMILLSQLVETQDIEKNKFVYAALTNCIHNFGLVIQQSIQKNSNLDTEVIVTRQVCRLIAKLPASVKEVEGLSLVSILTQRSLKTLGKDKEFLCHLILIKNIPICKVLADKIKQES